MQRALNSFWPGRFSSENDSLIFYLICFFFPLHKKLDLDIHFYTCGESVRMFQVASIQFRPPENTGFLLALQSSITVAADFTHFFIK